MKMIPISRFAPDAGWIALARAGDPGSVVCMECREGDKIDIEGFTHWCQIIAPTKYEAAAEWAREGQQLVDVVKFEVGGGRPVKGALKALKEHIRQFPESLL